jgi:hypothetical protein
MYKMDNITITRESDLHEKIQMILRQTDYTEAEVREKLIEHADDPIKVIKQYMGISDKKETSKKSLNQEIYRQLRSKLDDSVKDYNLKECEKLKEEIKNNNS